MKIIVVDDEQHACTRLNRILSELGMQDVTVFDRSIYAIEFARKNKIDVAFLDITMPEINGIELAKELKKINPFINLIFCTGYTEFMKDAIDLHSSGYLLKPAEPDLVQKALNNLLHPVEIPKPRFYAKTFGNFDFLVEGVPLYFHRSKSKEMLAYLIGIRGATTTRKELTAILFGDKYDDQTQNYFSKIYKELIQTLKNVGAEDIVRKEFNTYSVNTNLFLCDLYDYKKGDINAINAYHGEFMAQYEWADMFVIK